MSSESSIYKKLCRYRAKRARLQRLINNLERKLAGKKARWGQCSDQRNRT